MVEHKDGHDDKMGSQETSDAFPEPAYAVPLDIDGLLASMTTAQKTSLLAGKGFWTTQDIPALGIPSLHLSDGPHGLRKLQEGTGPLDPSAPATCFPTASAAACSFDPELIERMGEALGEECRANGIAVLLGPGVNMKRDPRCGRNFEYYSEDPVLAGKLAAAFIRGVQGRGVGTSLKHLACNNQEKLRMTSDSQVDDRALHEHYLRAFEIAVKEGAPWTIMPAYNRLNGTYCCENRELLEGTVRGEWGFDGVFVSDWGAQSSNLGSIAAGLDLVMPGPRPDYRKGIERAVWSDELDPDILDAAVRRLLALVNRHLAGQRIPVTCNLARHLGLARTIAEQSAVLLKNDGILPLAPAQELAVIGELAKKPHIQGEGSSKVNPYTCDDAFGSLCDLGARAIYARGYVAADGRTNERMLREAVLAARRKEMAVVFVGLPDGAETEGLDRRDLRLPAGEVEVIEQVCAANPNTVVVLQCGSPVEMPWRDKPRAILLMGLAGCQGGQATARLLTGAVNPCGKLAETWPVGEEDTCLGKDFPVGDEQVRYGESMFAGYRFHDLAGSRVAWPFGHGLSYTRFGYSNLQVTQGTGGFVTLCRITNEGDTMGSEVVQLYTAPVSCATFRPVQELQAFTKVTLGPGESRTVALEFPERAFMHHDSARGWVRDSGTFEVRVGASSRDIRLRETVGFVDGSERIAVGARAVKGEEPAATGRMLATDGTHAMAAEEQLEDDGGLATTVDEASVPIDDEGLVMVRSMDMGEGTATDPGSHTDAPEEASARKDGTAFTLDSTLEDIAKTPVGKLIAKGAEQVARSMAHKGQGSHEQTRQMVFEMPMRNLTMSGMSRALAQRVIDMANRSRKRKG